MKLLIFSLLALPLIAAADRPASPSERGAVLASLNNPSNTAGKLLKMTLQQLKSNPHLEVRNIEVTKLLDENKHTAPGNYSISIEYVSNTPESTGAIVTVGDVNVNEIGQAFVHNYNIETLVNMVKHPGVSRGTR